MVCRVCIQYSENALIWFRSRSVSTGFSLPVAFGSLCVTLGGGINTFSKMSVIKGRYKPLASQTSLFSRFQPGAPTVSPPHVAVPAAACAMATALASIYGAELRPARPGKPSRRSPVIKLGGSSDYNVPGPGAYTPSLSHKGRASEWIMGDRNARKSSVEPEKDSPGPVYQMRGSVESQTLSNKVSSPRFGFGTQPRLGGGAEATISPGPGAYSPRVTKTAAPGSIQTVAAGQLTELTTPQGSVQISEGTWSRQINRSLATVREGPTAETYTPRINSSYTNQPAYTMRALGVREGIKTAGAEVSPGPNAYHPHIKSRFGGGQMGDSPNYFFSDKNEDMPQFISKNHSRIFQGKHSPSPAAYTPLEEFGITSYTISNTSTHAPQYIFGSEVRPCAP